MGKFQLKRYVHDFNMAWRKLVPSKWRLRIIEDGGIYTLWNAEKRLCVANGAPAIARALDALSDIWAKELPA